MKCNLSSTVQWLFLAASILAVLVPGIQTHPLEPEEDTVALEACRDGLFEILSLVCHSGHPEYFEHTYYTDLMPRSERTRRDTGSSLMDRLIDASRISEKSSGSHELSHDLSREKREVKPSTMVDKTLEDRLVKQCCVNFCSYTQLQDFCYY